MTKKYFSGVPPVFAQKNKAQIQEELEACIGCSECLLACPAVSSDLSITQLNRETQSGPISPAVAQFARDCYQCGACVPACPVGLHRDLMTMALKVDLLREERKA